MIVTALIIAVALCALVPACLFLVNLRRFQPPGDPAQARQTKVAVLIPARNEESNIGDALRCVLANQHVALEVLVYDDASTDRTAAIVDEYTARDACIRLLQGTPLPEGWNGKQHACWKLAQASTAPLLLFLDADVRLEPEAIARCVAQQGASGVALLSGFPRILMKTPMEWLLLPLIQFVLLGFLPMGRMRRTTVPAYAAGCGQFMLVEREGYFAAGGHAAIPETRHDGLRLPKLFRQHGSRTDICDLTWLASVRMYESAAGVWNGLAKNATEGLGAPARIVPLTLLLLLGQVAPVMFLLWMTAVGIIFLPMLFVHHMFMIGISSPRTLSVSCGLFVLVLLASFLPRLLAARRFQQPLCSALLHPFGVLLLLAVQWYALARQVFGKPVGWRARNS